MVKFIHDFLTHWKREIKVLQISSCKEQSYTYILPTKNIGLYTIVLHVQGLFMTSTIHILRLFGARKEFWGTGIMVYELKPFWLQTDYLYMK